MVDCEYDNRDAGDCAWHCAVCVEITLPTEYIREIWQHGIMVAKVCCNNEADADREAGHYFAVYALDGEVRLKARSRKIREKKS